MATKYRTIGSLGKGGMARVFLAVTSGPAGFNKLTVLKELKPELVDDGEFVKMFLDEARLSARLDHANIVHTYDVLEQGMNGSPCLVMEYLDGQPLSTFISRAHANGKPPIPLHLRAISEVLAGLHYAHELKDYDGTPLGLVHRDVSPQNVFICYDGRVKLLDFGVAKARGALSHTAQGVIKGKLSYMAPEVLLNKRFDRRADVFSVGVMLWEALAERRISKGKSDIEVTGARASGTEDKLSSVAPNTPPALIAICEKAMALEPNDRYATALELKRALDAELPPSSTCEMLGEVVSRLFAAERKQMATLIEEQLTAPASGTPVSLPQAREADPSQPSAASAEVATAVATPAPNRQSPKRWLVGAVGAIVVVGLAGALLFRRSGPPPAPTATPAASVAPPATTAPPPPESAEPPAVAPSATEEPSAKPEATREAKASPRAGKTTSTGTKVATPSSATAAPTPAVGVDLKTQKKPPVRSIDETDPYAK